MGRSFLNQKMVLYFDTFIIDDKSLKPDYYYDQTRRRKLERLVRDSDSVYKYRPKLDIVKYTLASYSVLEWAEVIIRYQLEDPVEYNHLDSFILGLFPAAKIFHERSDSCARYAENLKILKSHGDPWVFFSPNNDHPYVGNECDSIKRILSAAEFIENKHQGSIISILYSHFTEGINTTDMAKRLWARYNETFSRKVYEDSDCVAIKVNKFLCDSVQIFRLKTLLRIFTSSITEKRVVRLEDTDFYLSNKFDHILVIPKRELCRHFDGYFHYDVWGSPENAPPPLFIPPGFFEGEISIRYGYPLRKSQSVNINPDSKMYSYFDVAGADLKCSIDEIPLSWLSRLKDVTINPDCEKVFLDAIAKKNSELLWDPWGKTPIRNVVGSIRHFVRSYVRKMFFFIKNTLNLKEN